MINSFLLKLPTEVTSPRVKAEWEKEEIDMKRYDYTIYKGNNTMEHGKTTKEQLDKLLNDKEWTMFNKFTVKYNKGSVTNYMFKRKNYMIIIGEEN
jgi:hypothetical protein